MSGEMLEILQGLLARAKKAGADAGDAVHIESRSLSVGQRLGEPEKLERSESADVGLRVFVGKKQAIVSSSDIAEETLAELAERAVAMARAVPEDPYCGLAEPGQLATDIPALDMCDPAEPNAETLIDWANRAEDTARAVEGVSNSEGAEAGWGRAQVSVIASNGFSQSYAGSHYSLSASVLAGSGTGMERDYDYTGAVYGGDLETPEEIGQNAGERTVKRLNPKKVASGQVPIVYDPRVSRSLVNHFANAINGAAIARETSFLKDCMDQRIFPATVNIIDDPHRHRGLRSKPFDGEGVANKRRNVIEAGTLTTWFLDLRSARQLGLETTGHASRGAGSPPSPSASNLYMDNGDIGRDALLKDVKSGLYVTELIGFGVNGLTGDYSRGAAGFWIEDGELAYPVSEVTIAGNLKDMFLELTAADDLKLRYGVDAPTLRIDGMTLAGT
ncbi:MAG: metallopeptidase TldD-related protein [Rhodospirillales bacterium]|jgi:PmbA protein|nr:modulator protein [Rhodospirillaceae bacterium]MDP6427809.1 metallopeptidase TldD-related protein [Rhodospirillales bacterium]MDP6644557.1 metallopeptidase TldD-related protein [Rhodospirillales bacterium]MDP6840309.1 metallopeptidase TldD-related protein [Rhodospirillales bacterium]